MNPGEIWRPWNYGLRRQGKRVGWRRVSIRGCNEVFGAFDDGRLVGCAQVSVCGPDELDRSDEFGGGDHRNGPFLKDHEARDTRFLLLHSLWVDPAARGRGVGGALCERLGQLGLATYAQFASDWVERWFMRRYRPDAALERQAA